MIEKNILPLFVLIVFMIFTTITIFKMLSNKKKGNPLKDGFYLIKELNKNSLVLISVPNEDYEKMDSSHANHLIKKSGQTIVWIIPKNHKEMQFRIGQLINKEGDEIKFVCIYPIQN